MYAIQMGLGESVPDVREHLFTKRAAWSAPRRSLASSAMLDAVTYESVSLWSCSCCSTVASML